MFQSSKMLMAAAALSLVTLSGCATPFRAEVARFQAMPAPAGQRFAVVARDEAERGGLEFRHYASLVAGELTRLGYRPAAPGEAPDLTVTMGYSVDEGRERRVRTGGYGDPFWGAGWGYARGFGRPYIIRTRYGFRYVHGFYDPFLYGGFGGFGDHGLERSYTVYTSGLSVAITRSGDGEQLFDGSAEAVSRSNDLTQLVPNLVEAMFTGFPGNSGERVRITIAPPEGGRR